MNVLARIGVGLASFWRGLITDPIRHGRLRDTQWPPGMRPIVVVGVVALCIAVLLILASPLIRATSPLSVNLGAITLSLPRILLPTIFWLVLLSLALMQTAALHTRARVTVVLTVMSALALMFIGSLDLQTDDDGSFSITVGKIMSVVASIALIVLVVVRRRARFAWWEFPAVLAIIGGAAIIALGRSAAQSAPFGIDFGPTAASLLMSSVGQLAVPAALAAGVAVAEFAIVASTAAVAAVHRPLVRRPASSPALPIVLLLGFLVIAAWRIIELGVGVVVGVGAVIDPAALPFSIGIVGAVAFAWWGIARVRRGSATHLDEVMVRLDDVGFPVAAALSITLAPVVVLLLSAQVLVSWGVDAAAVGGIFVAAEVLRGTAAITVVRAGVGVGVLVVAVLAARRGSRGLPELLAAIGVMAIVSVVPFVVDAPISWSSEAIGSVIAVGSIVLAIVLAARRALDARRLALLTVALLLSAAAAWRDLLADPLSVLIGSSGIALVLFGFIWGFLTDADITHHESSAYPRTSRVLLFLANAVFGVTVLAFGTLARDLDAGINLDAFAEFGDQLFGTALILAGVMAVWAAASAASADSRREAPSVVA